MIESPPQLRGARAVQNPRTPEAVVPVMLVAVMLWTLRIVHQRVCNTPESGLNTMLRLCYSDLPVVWQSGVGQGAAPVSTGSFELPVLIGYWVQVVQALTFATAPLAADPLGLLGRTTIFVALNVVLLGVPFLVMVFCLSRLGLCYPFNGGRFRVGFLAASCLLVWAAGTISWDLISAALVALCLLLWAQRRPVWAGVVLGLAASAAWYPLVLIVVLWALCRRAGLLDNWGRFTLAAIGVWLLANLPLLLTNTTGWLVQAQRWLTPQIGYGSGWFVVQTAVNREFTVWPISAVLVAAALIAIIALARRAPRRPRVAQLVALAVLAITLTLPVFSPQNVLWLVPVVLLARPVVRDWLIFTAGELIYWAAVWGYLQGNLFTAAPAAAYAVAIFIRLGVEGFMVIQIVRDVMQPWADPVHADHVDDPTGGVLDHAADRSSAWLAERPLDDQPVEVRS